MYVYIYIYTVYAHDNVYTYVCIYIYICMTVWYILCFILRIEYIHIMITYVHSKCRIDKAQDFLLCVFQITSGSDTDRFWRPEISRSETAWGALIASQSAKALGWPCLLGYHWTTMRYPMTWRNIWLPMGLLDAPLDGIRGIPWWKLHQTSGLVDYWRLTLSTRLPQWPLESMAGTSKTGTAPKAQSGRDPHARSESQESQESTCLLTFCKHMK